MPDQIASIPRGELDEFIYEIKQYCEVRLWELMYLYNHIKSKVDAVQAQNLSKVQEDRQIRDILNSIYILNLVFTPRSNSHQNKNSSFNLSCSIIGDFSSAELLFKHSNYYYIETIKYCDEILKLSADTKPLYIKEKVSLLAQSIYEHRAIYTPLMDAYIDGYKSMVKANRKVLRGSFINKGYTNSSEVIKRHIRSSIPDLEYFYAYDLFVMLEQKNVISDEQKIIFELQSIIDFNKRSVVVILDDLDKQIESIKNSCMQRCKDLCGLKELSSDTDFLKELNKSYRTMLNEFIDINRELEKLMSRIGKIYQTEDSFIADEKFNKTTVSEKRVLLRIDYASVLIMFKDLLKRIEHEISRVRIMHKFNERDASDKKFESLVPSAINEEEEDNGKLIAAEAERASIELIKKQNQQAAEEKRARKQEARRVVEPLLFSEQADSHASEFPSNNSSLQVKKIQLSAKNYNLLEELLAPDCKLSFKYTAAQLLSLSEELGAMISERNNKYILSFPRLKQPVFIAESQENSLELLDEKTGGVLSFHNPHRPGHNKGLLIGGVLQSFLGALNAAGISLDKCEVRDKSKLSVF